MKADPAIQRRLLDLAGVDAELNRINHRRRTLPALEEIGEAEREAQAKRDDLVVAQTSYGDIDREAKRLEEEIDQVRSRERRDRDLLESSSSPKQAEDLEHELQSLSRRQGVLEDELLEVMERREALETNVSKSREAVDDVEERLSEAQRRRDSELTDLDSDEAKRTAERESLAQQIPDELLALYERIRGQRGVGVGSLDGSRCGACRLELDRAALSEVREAAADDVLRHEDCGAILVRSRGSA